MSAYSVNAPMAFLCARLGLTMRNATTEATATAKCNKLVICSFRGVWLSALLIRRSGFLQLVLERHLY
jgi:hypothetical protein